VTKLSSKTDDTDFTDEWGPSLDETTVHVERVIGYWSRSFKGAETRYSTTEREALAAKEALVRFQPFIEGEKILLVTDHSALQWARTYENSNRRLAAWGAVFSVYAPGVEIIHRAGRVHSNVDPLSRLPRAPPEHTSPVGEDEKVIEMSGNLADTQESWLERNPAAKATFAAWTISDALENDRNVFAITRNQAERSGGVETFDRVQDASTLVKPTVETGGGNNTHSEPKTPDAEHTRRQRMRMRMR
jgi:hypothetical protein